MKKLITREEDNDPYIMGRPMGTLATLVFLAIMFGAPAVMLVYDHYHPEPIACTQDKCR